LQRKGTAASQIAMLSIFDHGPPPPCPAPFNLAAHVLRHAAARAQAPALEVLGDKRAETWSFAQLNAAVRGTGTGLRDAGLEPGDIVLMRLGNTVDFPIAYLAAIAAGVVPVPTSSQLTEPEVARIIADLSPAAILAAPDVATPDHPRVIALDDLRAMSANPPCDLVQGDPDRLAYIVYTSGTSGQPRAVAHAHRAIWARQMMIGGWYDLRPDDRLLHAGAFNWTYTLGTGLMDPWSIGATALIPAPGTPIPDIPALLADHRATIFAAAPGVYRKMLAAPLPRMADLRHGLSAGEKLSGDIRARWSAATGTALYEAYGLSECSTFISSSPDRPARGAALGQPQDGRRVAIVDADGQPVPQGAEGTIAVHRDDPGLMLGYLGQPDETAARFRGDWFVTGDQGAMAVDGQITYLGRADDMMNAGGYRVSPLEVEAVLSDHPDISEVGVTDVAGRSDARIIVAFYTGPKRLAETDLAAYAAQRLARYKQPRAYVHLPALPAGSNGKLLRRALPAYFEADVS
jgi:acyl-coenzyme A synthetase/AMP-(fatty) acid ligase